MAERKGRHPPSDTDDILADADSLGIRLDTDPDCLQVMALARRHRLTVCDALYLDLRAGATLATHDRQLAAAAQAEAVPLA